MDYLRKHLIILCSVIGFSSLIMSSFYLFWNNEYYNVHLYNKDKQYSIWQHGLNKNDLPVVACHLIELDYLYQKNHFEGKVIILKVNKKGSSVFVKYEITCNDEDSTFVLNNADFIEERMSSFAQFKINLSNSINKTIN